MSVLHIDFETRSVVDLKNYGLDIYARHPSTDVLCMAYAFDDEPVKYWSASNDLYWELEAVFDHVRENGRVVAHNVGFEFSIWNEVMAKRYGWPMLTLEQCDCTMARAHAMALPGALAELAVALNILNQKDMKGRSLMLRMSKPHGFTADGTPEWLDDDASLHKLINYCIQDVVVERECDKRMVPLSADERKVWLMDMQINARGIGVDRKAIEMTGHIVDEANDVANTKLRQLTEGKIQSVTEASKILKFACDNGVPMESLRKHDMTEWLATLDLPPIVRQVLELRQDGAKTSVAKLAKMQDMSLFDGRIRGMFQYHGANTGRWAGRAVQLQNLPRPDKRWKTRNCRTKS